jgi:hypothetical protein
MDRRLIFGILTLTVVGGVGYYLYTQSKKQAVSVKPNKSTKERVSEMKTQLAKTIDAKRDASTVAPQIFIEDQPEDRLKK